MTITLRQLNLKKSLLALAIAGLVTGCGGGGSSSDSGSSVSTGGTGGGSTGGSSTAESFTVKAIDGYLEKAEVYVDVNKNDKVDDSDTRLGLTDKNGELVVDGKYKGEQFVIKAIAGTTIDADSGPVDKTFELAAPPGIEVISPFTHMVAMEAAPEADSATVESAVSALAGALGIDAEILTGDFIAKLNDADKADEAKIAAAVARSVVSKIKEKIAVEQEVEYNDLLTVVEKVKAEAEKTVEDGENPLEKEYEVDDSGIVTEKPATKRFTDALLDSDAFKRDWAMFSIHPDGEIEWFRFKLKSEEGSREFCIYRDELSNQVQLDPVQSDNLWCRGLSINDTGELVWNDEEGERAGKLVYFHQAQDPHAKDGQESDLTTMVVVVNNGELLYMDNSTVLSLNDADDFTKDNVLGTWYDLSDDNEGEVTQLLFGKKVYNADGTLQMQSVDNPDISVSTEWTIDKEDNPEGTIGVRAIIGNAKMEKRYEYLFRTDGSIRLVRYMKSNYEGAYIESKDQQVIERIRDAWAEALK